MGVSHLIFVSVPGLRARDISQADTPHLFALANKGSLWEITPTFPCVTSCVQASMWTGRPPGEHGVIANGFYQRDRRSVEFWIGRNGVIRGRQIWEELRNRGITSAVWHAQNIKDAAADFIVTPEPIHEPDGTTRLWCYSKPDGLYQQMLDMGLGHFPLQHYWGPLANIESTRWILKAATWLMERHAPRFHWVYVPHLDYAAQKFGPNSAQAAAAVRELDADLGAWFERVWDSLGRAARILVVSEYAMTDVSGVLFPNRILREAGLLRVQCGAAGEHLDIKTCPAFAMVDHQLAHLYVTGEDAAERSRLTAGVAELFRGRPGIAGAYAADERKILGLNHERAGDVILVSDNSHWFAYYWWLDDQAAPAFAKTVDIHRKPGYDPVELFFDPVAKGIPLNAALVKGSHGAPAALADQKAAAIASWPIDRLVVARDTDLFRLCLDAAGP
jgi:predicted AlkP superfamily pyrophosphatase or phosphodiesterase